MWRRAMLSISQACSWESTESWDWVSALAESLLEPGRPGLLCLAIIAHNNPKWVTLQFCVLNGTLGERACWVQLVRDAITFKRGEKEVRKKTFSLCLEGCEDGVFPIAPEISGELHSFNPNIRAGGCMLTWDLMQAVCFNASWNHGAVWGWISPSLNFCKAVLCKTKWFLSFSPELAV